MSQWSQPVPALDDVVTDAGDSEPEGPGAQHVSVASMIAWAFQSAESNPILHLLFFWSPLHGTEAISKLGSIQTSPNPARESSPDGGHKE